MAFTGTSREWELLAATLAEELAARGGEGSPGPAERWAALEALPEPEPCQEVDSAAYWAMVDEVDATLAGEEPAGHVSQQVVDGLARTGRALASARLDQDAAVRLFDEAVVGGLESVGRLRTDLDAECFVLAQQAFDRGLHTALGLLLHDWLRVRMPWMPMTEATSLAQVVRFAATPHGSALGERMARGELALHRAAQVARTLTRLQSSLDPDQLEAYTGIATDAAARRDLSDRHLSRICEKLLVDLLDEKDEQERERRAHELRSVSRRTIGKGVVRFTVDAPALAATTIDGLLTSALAAPQPTEDGPDPRLPGQRRFDALMTVIDRGLGNPGAAPSTARASIILTMPFDPETGRPTGAAFTATGEVVPERAASQLACSGEITPVWLSPETGEPLQLGRTARYATPGQWKALVVRDQHCTFPGCTVPPQWCDTHHLVWWSRGGTTDIMFLALLCGQHHTKVHQGDGIHGEVINGVVVWHT
ncbi:DUF222 domain-containing protein [Ornithinimicrobium sp. Y1847]|uniref:HNH endonuclease signature motif containing protein n=1 Tax=Ornithinimicrobium sp. Y1847 TaxID=3405419 RepID=UPI003B67F0FD